MNHTPLHHTTLLHTTHYTLQYYTTTTLLHHTTHCTITLQLHHYTTLHTAYTTPHYTTLNTHLWLVGFFGNDVPEGRGCTTCRFGMLDLRIAHTALLCYTILYPAVCALRTLHKTNIWLRPSKVGQISWYFPRRDPWAYFHASESIFTSKWFVSPSKWLFLRQNGLFLRKMRSGRVLDSAFDPAACITPPSWHGVRIFPGMVLECFLAWCWDFSWHGVRIFLGTVVGFFLARLA